MDTEILEALKLAKDLVELLDSLESEDISEDLSDAIYDSNDVLDTLIGALGKEAIGK